jgi:hypothetical protein
MDAFGIYLQVIARRSAQLLQVQIGNLKNGCQIRVFGGAPMPAGIGVYTD